MHYLKEFNTLLQKIDYSRHTSAKFLDFLTLSTYSIAQPFYRNKEFEQIYLNTVNKYSKEQAETFSQMLALIVFALEEKHQDFLGQVFSTNDMGNKYKGQFFTPYHVSKMMAEISICEHDFLKKDLITVSEPCCGSGGMIIAFADVLKEKGINYQNKIYVEAIDLDEMCYKMTYIQLSLLGIPAKVIKGNTLSFNFEEALYTPLFFINNFKNKLEHYKKTLDIPVKIELKQNLRQVQTSQLSLF